MLCRYVIFTAGVLINSNWIIARCCQCYYGWPTDMTRLPGNALDFYEHVLGKSGHFYCRPRRFVVAERLFVDSVDSSKVIHRFEEHLRKKGRMPGVKWKIEVRTVVFTTFPKSLPEASTTARRFLSACSVCL